MSPAAFARLCAEIEDKERRWNRGHHPLRQPLGVWARRGNGWEWHHGEHGLVLTGVAAAETMHPGLVQIEHSLAPRNPLALFDAANMHRAGLDRLTAALQRLAFAAVLDKFADVQTAKERFPFADQIKLQFVFESIETGQLWFGLPRGMACRLDGRGAGEFRYRPKAAMLLPALAKAPGYKIVMDTASQGWAWRGPGGWPVDHGTMADCRSDWSIQQPSVAPSYCSIARLATMLLDEAPPSRPGHRAGPAGPCVWQDYNEFETARTWFHYTARTWYNGTYMLYEDAEDAALIKSEPSRAQAQKAHHNRRASRQQREKRAAKGKHPTKPRRFGSV